jgi:hypothetical protein
MELSLRCFLGGLKRVAERGLLLNNFALPQMKDRKAGKLEG